MSSDVKSTRLTSTGQVSASGQPARLRGVHYVGAAGAGTITVKNGGSGGNTVLTLGTPASAGASAYLLLPGNGIMCSADCHATLATVADVTFFWEG